MDIIYLTLNFILLYPNKNIYILQSHIILKPCKSCIVPPPLSLSSARSISPQSK